MKFSFEPSSGLVIVDSAILGQKGIEFLELALDTGANRTVINAEVIKAA